MNIHHKSEWPADNVERKNINELIPYASNARTHSDVQVDQIAASMKEWGWTNPVLVDETGLIIAGHGRILAAQKLGYDDVPVMTATGWTEAQKKAYVLADNQLALNAGWNLDVLSNELQGLDALDFDLDLLGFSDLGTMMHGSHFEPGSIDDQGKLDELDPIMVKCPNCGHSFDTRENGQA